MYENYMGSSSLLRFCRQRKNSIFPSKLMHPEVQQGRLMQTQMMRWRLASMKPHLVIQKHRRPLTT